MITERAGSVLNILVNEYINTATPVASEDIARLSPSRVSPATVRNAMSRLTEEGYISRPHISAGGVPSDRGYRYYVESLKGTPELPPPLRREIHERFNGVGPDVETWTRRCAVVLSHLTENMAIVTVPRASAPRLKHVQMVYLEEFVALLIIVLQEARLLRRLVPLDRRIAKSWKEVYKDREVRYGSVWIWRRRILCSSVWSRCRTPGGPGECAIPFRPFCG